MKTLYTNLKLPVCSASTIARTEVAVLEMNKDGTFADIFGSISKNTDSMMMTQAQIIEFVKTHKDKLRKDWYTFFLFKVGNEFFVAYVRLYDGGSLHADVDRFSSGLVWDAEYRHRIVVPQLALGNSATERPSDTLTLPDELTINGVVYVKK